MSVHRVPDRGEKIKPLVSNREAGMEGWGRSFNGGQGSYH